MKTPFKRFVRDESGITALETAIILIAFVVVAAVFAFTILSTGTFLTERSKEAAYAGLQEVRGSMELKGSVVLEDTGDYIVFTLATVAGGQSVDLSKVKIMYRDATNNVDVAYSSGTGNPSANAWIATTTDGSTAVVILKSGELARFKVNPSQLIDANRVFALQITPPSGAVLTIERTAPAQIDQVTDLH